MPIRTIPGPKGQWLIGDTLNYERDRLGWLLRARDQHGDVVRLAPGTVVLHDPAAIHRVLTADQAVPGHVAMTGRRSLTAHLPQWTQLTRQLWQHLGRRTLTAHLSRITAAFSARVQGSAGTPQDLLEFAFALCLDATVDFCVGAAGPDPEVVDATALTSRLLVQASAEPEPRVSWLPRPTVKKLDAASARLRALLLDRVLRRRSLGLTERDDLLGCLPPEIPAEQAADMLYVVLLASPGSPAGAACWTTLRLAEHPALAAWAAEKQEHADAFAREVLRLHPPNWLLARHLLSALEISGYELAAGTEVLIPSYHVHRDPRWWQRPADFAPERWLGSAKPHAPHAFLPFGSGPRLCPGNHLAMAQLTALIKAFAGHQLTMPPLAQLTEVPGPLLLPAISIPAISAPPSAVVAAPPGAAPAGAKRGPGVAGGGVLGRWEKVQ